MCTVGIIRTGSRLGLLLHNLSLYSVPNRRTLSNSGSSDELPRQESTVHKGTAFENRSLTVLHQHLSMDLRRVGGKSDGGVDLQGWWWVPYSPRTNSGHSMEAGSSQMASTTGESDSRRRIRVFAQCKMEKKKIGPKYIREMEGVLARHFRSPSVSSSPDDPIVGLFISSSPFTKSALLRAYSSPIPVMLLHLPPLTLGPPEVRREGGGGEEDARETSQSELGSIVCNSTLLNTDGILQGEIEPRWERSPNGVGEGRPGLWYRGRRIVSWTPEESSQHL